MYETVSVDAERDLWCRLFSPMWSQLDDDDRAKLRLHVGNVHGWPPGTFNRATADAEGRAIGRQVDALFANADSE